MVDITLLPGVDEPTYNWEGHIQYDRYHIQYPCYRVILGSSDLGK